MSVTDSEVADRNIHRFVLLMGALAVLGEAAVAGIYLALPRLPIPDYPWIGGIMILVTVGSACYAWFLGYASSVSFGREGVEFEFRHRSSWVPWNAFSGDVRKGDWPSLFGRRYNVSVHAVEGLLEG
jgi:hypothetical protein